MSLSAHEALPIVARLQTLNVMELMMVQMDASKPDHAFLAKEERKRRDPRYKLLCERK